MLTVVPDTVTTATGKSITYNLERHADQERFLANLAASWHRKLREMKPQIKIACDLYKTMPRGTTLCGCASFGQFCDEKLNVSRQGVYQLLGEYHAKRKAKKQAEQVLRKVEPPKLVLAEPDRQRLYAAGAAGVSYFEAMEKGDTVAAEKAKAEIMVVAHAQALRSAVFENQDIRSEVLALKVELLKCKKLVLGLLGEISAEHRRRALPAKLMATVAAIRKELNVDAASFGLVDDDVPPVIEASPKLPIKVGSAAADAAAGEFPTRREEAQCPDDAA